MSIDIRWMEDPAAFRLYCPAGTTDEEMRMAWGAHQRAAVGEGFCPNCRAQLIPHTSDEGPVQLCPDHGWWQIDYASERFSWWSARTPPAGAQPA